MDDPKPWLVLARVPGLHAGCLGPATDPRTLAREPRAALAALGFSAAAVAALRNPDPHAIAGDERWLAGAHRRLVTWGAADYPPLLAAIVDAPLVLFVEGAAEALSLPQLAIVGSRNPTALGRDTAEQFAGYLAAAGLVVTSGLALGIDAAAHRGGLAGAGSSVAVVGTGLDVVYPARNRDLAHRLAEEGALLSEFPLGTPAMAANFPRRNRLISGLSLGVLVVEAAMRSGSLITARLAGEQGREVFAIPGSIHSPLAKGCHRLIKQGAKLVDSAQDILEELELPGSAATIVAAAAPRDARKAAILDAMGFDPCDIDTLVERTALPAEVLAGALLELELAGDVSTLPGGKYQRLR
jgi:DNA processing protein